MPFLNFDSRHFSVNEKNAVTAALTALETALAAKVANLSPEERKQFGSVNEQNKLVINKVKEYRDIQPALGCPDVDWVEFMNDFDTRAFLQGSIQRLQNLIDGMTNAKILHDWDNYQSALIDYDYAKFKFNANVPNYQNKVEELSQFFAGRPPGSKQNTPPESTS
ncbi:MAG: hypothetical protein WC622_16970 [Pedobacter sp.]|jgi:hypothetical protein|uniref:hypothetical protein n=1 Tax=Pedobacter sp. TaxID=1411316 RepID=UPI0035678FC7